MATTQQPSPQTRHIDIKISLQ